MHVNHSIILGFNSASIFMQLWGKISVSLSEHEDIFIVCMKNAEGSVFELEMLWLCASE